LSLHWRTRINHLLRSRDAEDSIEPRRIVAVCLGKVEDVRATEWAQRSHQGSLFTIL
jgi:hypothetical protein